MKGKNAHNPTQLSLIIPDVPHGTILLDTTVQMFFHGIWLINEYVQHFVMLLDLIFVFLSLLQEAPQHLRGPAVTSVKFKHSML